MSTAHEQVGHLRGVVASNSREGGNDDVDNAERVACAFHAAVVMDMIVVVDMMLL